MRLTPLTSTLVLQLNRFGLVPDALGRRSSLTQTHIRVYPAEPQDDFLASDAAEAGHRRRGPGMQGVQYRTAAEDAQVGDPETSAAAAATLAKVTPMPRPLPRWRGETRPQLDARHAWRLWFHPRSSGDRDRHGVTCQAVDALDGTA